MNEIVKRLKENRDIERAKQIMESIGYSVSKNSVRESFLVSKCEWNDETEIYDTLDTTECDTAEEASKKVEEINSERYTAIVDVPGSRSQKEFREDQEWREDDVLKELSGGLRESAKYRAYYVKNPRGYGSPTYLDKELNSEEEAERYCNSFNVNGGYEDEYGNQHYVDYEIIEESAPVDESAKYADWYLESKRLEESADKFKAGDKVKVLLPWTLNARVDGIIDHRATPEEFKKEKSYIENGVQYFSSAPYPNASNDDEFYMVKVQWKGKDDLLLSPVQGITPKDSSKMTESAPARNPDSTDEEKRAYARKLLEKAKESNDERVAWELIDFLYDTNLLKGF